MPKVLQILYSGLGGQSAVFFSLVEAELPGDVSHDVVFFGNVPVLDAYKKRCLSRSIEPFEIKKQRGPGIFARCRLFNRIAAIQPDVIILHLPLLVTTVAKYCRKFPSTQFIAVEHHSNKLKTPRDWWYSKLLMQHSDAVVYLNPGYMKEVECNLGSKFFCSKAELIPNGIDVTHYKSEPSIKTKGVSARVEMLNQLSVLSDSTSQNASQEPTLILGMCSRVSAEKDIDSLVRSLQYFDKKQSRPKLFIAGDGPHRAALEKLSAEVGVSGSITFLGMLNESDLKQFLNLLDIYVHATLAETMSTSVMQAMSMGLPVVASDVPGMACLIDHKKTGLLVPPKNPKCLYQAIIDLSTDQGGIDSIGGLARAFAEAHLSNVSCWSSYKQLFLKS